MNMGQAESEYHEKMQRLWGKRDAPDGEIHSPGDGNNTPEQPSEGVTARSASDLAADVREGLNSRTTHYGRYHVALDEMRERLEAAEAQVAALTKERDALKQWQRAYSKGRAGLVESADQDFARAEAAEAALADTRRALGQIASHPYTPPSIRADLRALAAADGGTGQGTE